MMHIFRTRLTTKYFPLPLVPSLCTELWGIWGVCSRKSFFRNLLWMFITFHKQVSVIKSYRPPSALLPPFLPSPCPLQSTLFFCIFFISKFLFSFYKILWYTVIYIFKQLIRVLLCFHSRDYEYCRCRCCCCSRRCYLRKSFYQKTFFVTRNYEKQHSMCDTRCTSSPCSSDDYERL